MRQMTMRRDVGLDRWLRRLAIHRNQEGATGIFLGQRQNRFRIGRQLRGIFGVDEKIHQRGIRARVIRLPKLLQLAINGRDLHRTAQSGTG